MLSSNDIEAIARMTNCGAGTVVVAGGECAADVVLVPRSDAEADHVDEEILALACGCSRKHARLQSGDVRCQHLGDRSMG